MSPHARRLAISVLASVVAVTSGVAQRPALKPRAVLEVLSAGAVGACAASVLHRTPLTRSIGVEAFTMDAPTQLATAMGAVTEEAMTRGTIEPIIRTMLPHPGDALLSAALFALCHAPQTPTAARSRFIASLVFSWTARRFSSGVLAACVAHHSFNLTCLGAARCATRHERAAPLMHSGW